MTYFISSLDAPLIKPSEGILANPFGAVHDCKYTVSIQLLTGSPGLCNGSILLELYALSGNGSDATLNRIGLLLGTGLLVPEAESTKLETTLTLLGRRCAFSA
jgi:hypothetical protein